MVIPRRITLALAALTSALFLVGVILLLVGPRSVQRVPIRGGSSIAAVSADPDYADSYRMRVPMRSITPDFLEAIAFQKGELVTQTEDEVVFRDFAPGLRFHVSYSVREVQSGAVIVEVSTVVNYTSSRGRFYFFFVRPVHRMGMPWVVRHFVRRAIDGVR